MYEYPRLLDYHLLPTPLGNVIQTTLRNIRGRQHENVISCSLSSTYPTGQFIVRNMRGSGSIEVIHGLNVPARLEVLPVPVTVGRDGACSSQYRAQSICSSQSIYAWSNKRTASNDRMTCIRGGFWVSHDSN